MGNKYTIFETESMNIKTLGKRGYVVLKSGWVWNIINKWYYDENKCMIRYYDMSRHYKTIQDSLGNIKVIEYTKGKKHYKYDENKLTFVDINTDLPVTFNPKITKKDKYQDFWVCKITH